MINANSIGVKFLRINKTKRQELKVLIFQILSGKKPDIEEFWALKNVSFQVEHGEIIGIIGSNGAGKSTLCRVLANILVPDEGDISIQGLVSALLSLGTGFNTELSGRENIYLNGMMLGFSKQTIDLLFDKIVEFSGIEPFINTPIKQYSKGMQARLGFSIAAMLEPEILVLDETLNPGDKDFKKKAGAKIQELIVNAKAVIIVSHDLEFIKNRTTRAFWLEKGEIKKTGDSIEICEEYSSLVPKPKSKKRIMDSYKKSSNHIIHTPMVEINNVGVRYSIEKQDFWALKNISFSIYKGEILGIIGANGAGKSTLCKVIGKILRPNTGSISLSGKTTEILGFGAGFNKELTGSENIYLNGLLLGIPFKTLKKNFDSIVEFADLGSAINQPLKEFSSGMKSRLGFSIATSVVPEILIIDEALSAGDLAFQQKAAQKIQSFIDQAKAVIIVTHNLNFVENVCTRAIWLNKGELMYSGDPVETISLYKNYK